MIQKQKTSISTTYNKHSVETYTGLYKREGDGHARMSTGKAKAPTSHAKPSR